MPKKHTETTNGPPHQQQSPKVARKIIHFGGDQESVASTLNYDVPLPGAFTTRRSVLLDLGLGANPWLSEAHAAGVDLAQELDLQSSGSDQVFSAPAAAALFSRCTACGWCADRRFSCGGSGRHAPSNGRRDHDTTASASGDSRSEAEDGLRRTTWPQSREHAPNLQCWRCS